MAFKKGESGNPAGRPRGTSEAAKLRRAIRDDTPGIIAAMIEAAKAGDVAAARVLLDGVCPALFTMKTETTTRAHRWTT